MLKNCSVGGLLAAILLTTACAITGHVQQGRVVAYNKDTHQITLIAEPAQPTKTSPGVLPPLTITTPTDPAEMGPEPAVGGLLAVDFANHRITVYDPAAQSFRVVPFTPLREKHDVAKNPGLPTVNRDARTITIYSTRQKTLVTFAATPELLALPASTWRGGDTVRYYYKEPSQALRLMNVTKTDLSKATG